MGLLDELKQQAEAALLKQQDTEDQLNERRRKLHTKLSAALQYWVEAFKSLNIVKPEVYRNYFIEGSTQLEHLRQSDYSVNANRVTIHHYDYIESIVLRFRCSSAEKLVVLKETPTVITRYQEHLWLHGLKFDLREVRNGAYLERGIFTISADVTANLTFTADIDTLQFKLIVRNLERLGESAFVYDYARVNSELMEEIAKAILGKPNKYRAMGRPATDELVPLSTSSTARSTQPKPRHTPRR